MPVLGIHRRLRRLQAPDGRFFLFAADHGLPAGPLPGLENLGVVLAALSGSPLTGVILNPGMVSSVPSELFRAGLVVHLSGGTILGKAPTSKVLVCSVERAISLGADAVSVQVHLGEPEEDRMLADAGRVVDAADRLGLPALVMAYPPGATAGAAEPDSTQHAARAAAELGADLVQVPHPGSEDLVRAVVDGCPVPVLLTGGPRAATADLFLDAVRSAIAGGAAGISVGRNLFQNPSPAGYARRIGEVLSEGPVIVPISGGASS